MKDGDVFRWYFKNDTEYRAKHACSGTAYWCLDNQCVYWEGVGLVDTYWTGLSGKYLSSSATILNEEEIGLEFVCNLNEVEFIHKSDADEYDKVYDLSRQKGCYPLFAVDKGACKSKKAILTKKERELANVKSEIEYLQRKVVWLTEEIAEVSAENPCTRSTRKDSV